MASSARTRVVNQASIALLLIAVSVLPASGQDTLRVLASGAPLWGESPRLVEELRIGTLNGPPEFTFGQISALVVTAAGDVWVSDVQAGVVRRYSSSGDHLSDVGGKGQGPGEFNQVSGLRVLPDGHVAAWDPLNSRVHIFDDAGEFRRDVRVPTSLLVGVSGLPTMEVDSSGTLYLLSIQLPEERGGNSTPYWIRITDGSVADTLWHPPTERVRIVDPTITLMVPTQAGHRVSGRNDEYVFHQTQVGGTVLTIQRPYDPVRYTRSERREKQVRENHFAERNARPPERIPRDKPVWKDFQVDTEGRLWVRRYVAGLELQESAQLRELRVQFQNPERSWAEPEVFDVIDADGAFLGSIEFPNSATLGFPRVQVRAARGLYVWVVERGEWDEQYVVRYRIEPSA